jgi:hypothetical protein
VKLARALSGRDRHDGDGDADDDPIQNEFLCAECDDRFDPRCAERWQVTRE